MRSTETENNGLKIPDFGIWITTPNHWAVEMAKAVGFSSILVDLEHGTINLDAADGIISLGRGIGLDVLVRVGSPDRVPIQQALDAGAHSIILPQVRDLEHARVGSSFAKYPPLGLRGMGSPRSLNYGDTPSDFVQQENVRTRCLIMIETPGALQDVKEIVSLPTVDGIFMGPYDLSLTRGRGQYGATPQDRADSETIAFAARSAGKFIGMPAGNLEAIHFAIGLGANTVSLGEDLGALNLGLRNMLEATIGVRKG